MRFLDAASLPADLQGTRLGQTQKKGTDAWLDVSKLPPLPVDDGWIDADLALELTHDRPEFRQALKRHSRAEALDRFAAEFCQQIPNAEAVHHHYGMWRQIAEDLGGPETAAVIAGTLRQADLTVLLNIGAAYILAVIGDRAHIPALALVLFRMEQGFPRRGLEDRLRAMVARLKLTEQEFADWSLPDQATEAENARMRSGQAERLERAMIGGQRWSPDVFELRMARHPVMAPLAAGLVWGYFNDSDRLLEAFLIGGEYPAAPEGARVGIVHPAHVSPEQAAEWRGRTKNLKAPFAQWKSAAGTLATTGDATSLPQLPAKRFPAAALLCRLEALGWHRPKTRTELKFHGRAFPELGVTAVIEYTGIPVRYGGEWVEQSITDCFFVSKNQKVPLSRVSPIAISTVVGDLEALAGGKK